MSEFFVSEPVAGAGAGEAAAVDSEKSDFEHLAVPDAELDAHLLSSITSGCYPGGGGGVGGSGVSMPLTAGFNLNASARARLLRWYQLRLERYSEHSVVRAPGIARPGDQVRLVQSSAHKHQHHKKQPQGQDQAENQSSGATSAGDGAAKEVAAGAADSSGPEPTEGPSAGPSATATAPTSAPASTDTKPEDPGKYVVPHIAVKDLDHSWLDGLAFCALLHLYRPESTYDTLTLLSLLPSILLD